MAHHVVGIQTLMFIPERLYGFNSKSVMGGAITTAPSSGMHTSFLGAQPKQQKEDRESYIRFCVLLKSQ